MAGELWLQFYLDMVQELRLDCRISPVSEISTHQQPLPYSARYWVSWQTERVVLIVSSYSIHYLVHQAAQFSHLLVTRGLLGVASGEVPALPAWGCWGGYAREARREPRPWGMQRVP